MIEIGGFTVWSSVNDELVPNDRELVLDSSHVFTRDRDCFGPLHVESGLTKSDVIVGIGFIGLSEELAPEYPSWVEADEQDDIDIIGYLVSHTDDDGGGILVADELALRNPAEWINQHIGRVWSHLHANGYNLADFDRCDTEPEGSMALVDSYIAANVELF